MNHHVSLFSPDWDSAANDLNKAAVCFKVKHDEISSSDPQMTRWLAVGRNVKLLISGHARHMPTLAGLVLNIEQEECADQKSQYNRLKSHRLCFCSLYHAAKQLEGALLVCREQGRLDEVVTIKYLVAYNFPKCCNHRIFRNSKLVSGGGPCQQRWVAV